MKKFLKMFFDRTFWKFIIVGVANTLFGTGIMFVFYNVFHFSYWISSASNYVFGSILSYVLNRLFTFKNEETTIRTLPRFVLNISLCYLLAYGIITFIGIYYPVEIPNLYSFVVAGVAVLITISIVFFILAVLVDRRSFKSLIKKVMRNRA